MGNLLRVLNDKGTAPKVDFFVDFESEFICKCTNCFLKCRKLVFYEYSVYS